MKPRQILCIALLLSAPTAADDWTHQQPKPTKLHMLVLDDGDQFPALIMEETIRLSNGWEEFSLDPDSLVNVSFDGGLYGTICDSGGQEKELDYAFIKDRFLHVKALNSSQTIEIPWTRVYAIRRHVVPCFGVKEEDLADKELIVRMWEKIASLEDEKEQLSSSGELMKEKLSAKEDELLEQQRSQSEDLAEKERTIALLISSLEDLSDKEAALSVRQQELEAMISQLQGTLPERDKEIKHLRAQMTLNEEEWGNLGDAHAVQVEALAEKINNLLQELNESGRMGRVLESRNQELTSELALSSNDLQKTRQEISDKNIQLEHLENNETCARESLNALQQAYEEIIAHNGRLNEEIADAHSEIASSQEAFESMQNQLDRECQKGADLKKKMDQIFPQLDLERERGRQLQQEVSSLLDKIKEMEGALQVVESKEMAFQERYGRLVRENHALKNDKEGLILQLKHEQDRLNEQRDLAAKLSNSLNSQRSMGQTEHQFNPGKEPMLISFKGIHIVAEGENLNNISMKYYHTPHRFAEIYESNRDVISDVDHLKVGTALVIPE